MTAGLCFSSCGLQAGSDKSTFTLYAPDGAPALAVAGMMQEDFFIEYGGKRAEIDCYAVNPTLIATKVTNKDEGKNADFCILPLTAASKLLGSGENYALLGAVTHGNLYLVSANSGVQYTQENLSALQGKTVGVLQINEVPGLVLKTALVGGGVAWQECKNDGNKAEDKVNLVAISSPAELGVVDADCYLLGEPAASAQAGKGYAIVGSLQELYGGENGYPQAVLVGKKSVMADKAFTAAFAKAVAKSAEWLKAAEGAEIVSRVTASLEDSAYATTLKAPLLTTEVLGRCGVRFTQTKDCKAEVEAFLTAAATVNAQMAVLPQTAFYYMEDLGV